MARLSILDMDIEQDKGGANIASSVAWGYGPAHAMPTLMGMMGGQEETGEMMTDSGQTVSMKSVLLMCRVHFHVDHDSTRYRSAFSLPSQEHEIYDGFICQ